jgi:hypothetical protein
MVDLTQGWIWFACGLGVTVLTGLALVGVVLIARHAEARRADRR